MTSFRDLWTLSLACACTGIISVSTQAADDTPAPSEPAPAVEQKAPAKPVAMDAGGEAVVIDDFESYRDGQVIGSSAESSPWRRFGHATTDNVMATNRRNKVISGQKSGQYGAYWPNPFGAVRYVFPKATDLSGRVAVGIKIKSDEPSTRTLAKFAISNGTTTFVVLDSAAISDQAQAFVFPLDEAAMLRTVGDDSFQDVIRNVTLIGLNFISSDGEYVETIIFDDLQFPASASVASGQ